MSLCHWVALDFADCIVVAGCSCFRYNRMIFTLVFVLRDFCALLSCDAHCYVAPLGQAISRGGFVVLTDLLALRQSTSMCNVALLHATVPALGSCFSLSPRSEGRKAGDFGALRRHGGPLSVVAK